MENMPRTTITLAELTALLRGLQIAKLNGLTLLEVATESTEVIRMLILGNSTYDSIISECRLLIQRMVRVVVKYNYREQNRVVDKLANEGSVCN